MNAEQNGGQRKRRAKIVIPMNVIKAAFNDLMRQPRACDGITNATLDTFYSTDPAVQEHVIATFCARCPVTTRAKCLEVGILTDSTGILGGKTKKERNALE